jgi:hypothetical protein
MAYVRMSYLFWRMARTLATQSGPLATLPIKWGDRRSTKKMYRSMCDIPADISKEEMTRRMAAFYDDFRGIFPTVTLHGVEFRAAPAAAANSDQSETRDCKGEDYGTDQKDRAAG